MGVKNMNLGCKTPKIILGKSQCAGAPCSFMENCKYIDDARTNTKIELLE